jgi:RNA polymerase sigma factor (sigma-70 family)
MESLVSARIRFLYGYRCQVLKRARHLLGHEEVFLRLIDADARMLLHPEPLAWLLRVTTNLCLNRLRDDRRRRQLLAVRTPGADQNNRDADARTAVAQLLTGVPEDLQQIAVYHHADGMTCDEIAPLFGVSRRTIGNRLLAFQRLALAKVTGTEPWTATRSAAAAILDYEHAAVGRRRGRAARREAADETL